MKKVLSLLAGLFLSTVLFAQDVLTTTDGKIIDALVVEITETTVSYRKWDNANGPTYKMNIENVHKIRYENGTIETFSNLKQSAVPSATASRPVSENKMQQSQETPALTKTLQPSVLMIGGDLYNLQGRKLEKYEIQRYFGDMYGKWRKYTAQYNVGSVFCGMGMGFCLVGLMAGCFGDPSSEFIIGMSVGTIVCEVIALPLVIVGAKKRNALYRERVSQDYQYNAELMFGGTKYGTGFSLRF